ncbi:hypothetical protein R3X28_15025 [Maribacter sp. TH_r10]|uniref:hypothetical protein n=1 Tax=Maribacter sp. TH_r10 TaxID=3082086 RepID=UPI002954AC19|nr:hypothetical protein [Maribacter sp. TH_r10]MDV7140203.1 hypothetical protein [Maribacter sp. TH_r10]
MISRQDKIFLTIVLFLIALQTVSPWGTMPLGNIVLWWGMDVLVLALILKVRPRFYDRANKTTYIIFAYLYWNISCIVRGGFVAENYWEWKNLFTMGFVLLLPTTIFISTNRLLVQTIFNVFIKYLLPAFILFTAITYPIAWGVYLIPISVLLLFLPLLTRKWQIALLGIALFAATASIAARSNVIKFAVPFLFGLLFYVRPFVGVRLLGLGRLLLLGLPITLFILALTGTFNVFKIDQYMKGDYTTVQESGETEDLTADTRTGLYVEVLASAIYNEYVWLGRTPARGNDSELFGAEIEAQTKTGKFERYANEVSVLNVFTWTGLIGVVLYFLVFFRATFLAVHRSKSWYMKILGLYVAFRWSYAWVEDFSRFDLSYILLWILIGMCFSSSFRNMTDMEFKYWARGIFDIRYRKATLKKVRVKKQF